MSILIRIVGLSLAIGIAPAGAAEPSATAVQAGCLDHSRLLSRAAYRPDTRMPVASCGHLLSTDIVVKPRSPDRT